MGIQGKPGFHFFVFPRCFGFTHIRICVAKAWVKKKESTDWQIDADVIVQARCVTNVVCLPLPQVRRHGPEDDNGQDLRLHLLPEWRVSDRSARACHRV